MDTTSTPQTTTTATRVTVSKGITLMPPVIGRIAIGHTAIQDGKAIPVMDDHFSVTTLMQDKDSRVWESHPIQATLGKGEEKLRAIPVRIAYNDVGLNLHNRLTAFDAQTGRPLCVGNGQKARRVTSDGVKEIDCPRPEACEHGARLGCRNFSRAYFRFDGQTDELGVFILRTTSYNSTDRLGSRLNQLSGLTNGCIANMPLLLVLSSKTSTLSGMEPVYFVDLVTRPGMPLLEAAKEARAHRDAMTTAGLSLETQEAAISAGLANGDFADEIEDVDEWLSDDDLIAAVTQRSQRNSGLRGMDSLTRSLKAVAPPSAESGDAPDGTPGSAPSAHPATGSALVEQELHQSDLLGGTLQMVSPER